MYTMLIHYYNNAKSVLRQITLWQSLEEETLRRVCLRLVDDCSSASERINFEHLRKTGSLRNMRLSVLRVQDDITWNQTGARNLGIYQSTTEWVFCTDIDHFADELAMKHIYEAVGSGLEPKTIYRVGRRDIKTKARISSHTNSFLVKRDEFIKVGGYDEDFAGGAGHSDKFFFWLWNKAGNKEAELPHIVIDVDPSAGTKNLSREILRNRMLYLRKTSGEAPENKARMQFRWRVEFDQEHDVLPLAHVNSEDGSRGSEQAANYGDIESVAASSVDQLSLQQLEQSHEVHAQTALEGEGLWGMVPLPEELHAAILGKGSFFRTSGWLRSARERRGVDGSGSPLPWFNYAFIHFLTGRLNVGMDVFEYGCGNSTLWLQSRVRTVTSCEHDRLWLDEVKKKVSENVHLIYESIDSSGKYERCAANTGKKYHVIIIDGRLRVECARESITALLEDGVIVWDNSNRVRYAEGYDLLQSVGFRRLEFTALGPIENWETSTSIFYRSNNCFNI